MRVVDVAGCFTIRFISKIPEYVAVLALRDEGRFDTHESCLFFASTATYTTRSLLPASLVPSNVLLYVCTILMTSSSARSGHKSSRQGTSGTPLLVIIAGLRVLPRVASCPSSPTVLMYEPVRRKRIPNK